MKDLEIERKWLITGFPTNLGEPNYECNAKQDYISINPEIRIIKKTDIVCKGVPVNFDLYRITCKSSGTLVREEYQQDLTKEIYGYLMSMAKHKSIDKVFKIYQLESDLNLECSLVDAGTDTEFYYAEVEFPDEATANNFILPIYGVEVTEDPKYKMKHYYRHRG